MILTGISDEAGSSIETQIQAHKELGWQYMELRLVDGKNIAGELTDSEFDRSAGLIESRGMKTAAFASAIGNWSRPVTGDFNLDVDDLKCSIPRMKRLGTKYIRIMSWVGEGVGADEWRKEAVRRLKKLARMAEDSGIILLHENCTGWGGLSARNMVEISVEIDSPSFKLLYDVGNTVSHGCDPEDFFKVIRRKFAYVHIKDARKNPTGGKSSNYVYCGDGDAMVEEIVGKMITEDGYDGFISIEPHVSAIVHQAGEQASEEDKYLSYVKYGKKFIKMVDDILSRGSG